MFAGLTLYTVKPFKAATLRDETTGYLIEVTGCLIKVHPKAILGVVLGHAVEYEQNLINASGKKVEQ